MFFIDFNRKGRVPNTEEQIENKTRQNKHLQPEDKHHQRKSDQSSYLLGLQLNNFLFLSDQQSKSF